MSARGNGRMREKNEPKDRGELGVEKRKEEDKAEREKEGKRQENCRGTRAKRWQRKERKEKIRTSEYQ